MRTPLRLVKSILAGITTFYAIGLLLYICGAQLMLDPYRTVFGLSDRIASTISPPTFGWEYGEFYGRYGHLIFYLVTLGFWTALFAFVYFRFVFRRRPAI